MPAVLRTQACRACVVTRHLIGLRSSAERGLYFLTAPLDALIVAIAEILFDMRRYLLHMMHSM